MPPGVSRADGNHSQTRSHGAQDRGGGGGPAPMVAHLQEIGLEDTTFMDQIGFDRRLQVAGQKNALSAEGQAQNEGVVIAGLERRLRSPSRIELLQAGAADAEPHSAAGGDQWN